MNGSFIKSSVKIKILLAYSLYKVNKDQNMSVVQPRAEVVTHPVMSQREISRGRYRLLDCHCLTEAIQAIRCCASWGCCTRTSSITYNVTEVNNERQPRASLNIKSWQDVKDLLNSPEYRRHAAHIYALAISYIPVGNHHLYWSRLTVDLTSDVVNLIEEPTQECLQALEIGLIAAIERFEKTRQELLIAELQKQMASKLLPTNGETPKSLKSSEDANFMVYIASSKQPFDRSILIKDLKSMVICTDEEAEEIALFVENEMRFLETRDRTGIKIWNLVVDQVRLRGLVLKNPEETEIAKRILAHFEKQGDGKADCTISNIDPRVLVNLIRGSIEELV